MTENYLTREMGFKVARKHADKLFAIAVVVGCALPILALIGAVAWMDTGAVAVPLTLAAVACHLIGMLVERWLFFAEARHSVMSFYGS